MNILNKQIKNIKDFYNDLETINDDTKLYREITVKIHKNPKTKKTSKIPEGEKNNATLDFIQNNRGKGNTLSLYLKYIKDLFVIDFDEKQITNCKLFDKLKDSAFTETQKGYHFYVYIKNIDEFSNQQKISNENIDIDLIKKNNIWETKTRNIYGEIQTFEWDELKQFFDIKKMNFVNESVPEPEPEPKQDTEDADEDWLDIIPKCSEIDFKKHIESIKPRYGYNDWVNIGMICYNNFDGDETGLKFWNDYSKLDDSGSYEGLAKLTLKYNSFGNSIGKKLTYKTLVHWNLLDFPIKNKYEQWYNENTLIENMNKECCYYTQSGDIIYFNDKVFLRNKKSITMDFYSKFKFKIIIGKSEKEINPFNLWLNHIDRKNVDTIIFNPTGECQDNEFNIWRGFKIEKTGVCDQEKIQKWLNHIKNIWADGDLKTYDYILNWFAKILQTPWKKNNICLVLHSVEGVGKSLILDMIGKIIGTDYYYSTSSLKHILGDFNGDAEGKILVNLNETNWGGDKKMVGSFKEFITDSTIVINKKGIQSYSISNFSNTIITTNEEWIVNINDQDRRFNLRECRNEKFEVQYYKDIAKTDLQEIANFLYNRDISDYDSRDFEKSDLHKEQIQMNMNSVEIFWENLKNNEGLNDYKTYENWSVKSDFYKSYVESVSGTHSVIYSNMAFWRTLQKIEPKIGIKKCDKYNKYPSFKLPTRK